MPSLSMRGNQIISAPNWRVREVLLKFQTGTPPQLLKQNHPSFGPPEITVSPGNLAQVCETDKNKAAGIM